jgi:hypothetical protein
MIQAFVYVRWQLYCSEAVYLSVCCRLLLCWEAVFSIEDILLEIRPTFDNNPQSGPVRTMSWLAKK